MFSTRPSRYRASPDIKSKDHGVKYTGILASACFLLVATRLKCITQDDSKETRAIPSSNSINSKAYTAIIEAYGQDALYEEAVVTFNKMNLEVLRLVDESEEPFQEIEKMVEWDDAYKLLDHEMIKCDSSNIHQVIGQMIRGDYDDASNWQMVEYVFDNLTQKVVDKLDENDPSDDQRVQASFVTWTHIFSRSAEMLET
nr:hypothetical protein [Tanacetum cinerariifolium]